MTVAALTHGYPPVWSMGGEISLHRTLQAVHGDVTVLTNTPDPYEIDGIHVRQISIPDVLDVRADPAPITAQIQALNARVVVAQNELSLPGVLAARRVNAVSVVSVHTPPKYGAAIRQAVRQADHRIYNTRYAADQWRDRRAVHVHPPVSPLPVNPGTPHGDAYTLLSSLVNKGVEVVLELARRMPSQRFIIVRSPAETTHGLPDIETRCAALPNVELRPRVAPDRVAAEYFSQTRILLVPSRYETYGMSAIEAAGHRIPSVHVDTPDVREGISEAAVLIPPLNADAAQNAITRIEAKYEYWSRVAADRAEWLMERQITELDDFANWIDALRPR